MVTVGMSVKSRSTDGRYLGRCIHRVSVDCRSSSGQVSIEHRPLYRAAMYRPIIGSLSVERSTDSRSR